MSFLDTIRSAAGDDAGQQAHQAFGNVLQNTQLGGMSGLLEQLAQGGLGEQVRSWCGGDQAGVSPDQIQSALGDEHVQAIAGQLGLSPDALTRQLSQHLPAMAQAHAADGDDEADVN
jgi:uncharacterized protein YidB (DUF937 family)